MEEREREREREREWERERDEQMERWAEAESDRLAERDLPKNGTDLYHRKPVEYAARRRRVCHFDYFFLRSTYFTTRGVFSDT